MAEVMVTVSAKSLEATVTDLFRRAGLNEADAAFMGQCLVDADLRGVHSHGTRYAVNYVRALQKGDWNAGFSIKSLKDRGAVALLDADRGPGHRVGYHAMSLAIKKAKEFGNGTVSVKNSTHCGAMAYFTQMAADAGCIGFAVTNAGIRMAPTGGSDPIIGLNPLSWAAPTNRPWSVNLDMATSVVAGSKLGLAIEKGEKIPFGWALDKDGKPTDDPRAAMEGVLLPLGGPKGYGMSVCLDIISGVLSGGRFGAGLGEPGTAHIFQAVDIDFFIGLDEFRSRMGELVDQIKNSTAAPNSSGIFLPGEIEYNNKTARREKGIPMTRVVIDEINVVAGELGSAHRVE